MTTARVEQVETGDDGPATSSASLLVLEEKAGRLFRRCRYDDAANAFQTLVDAAQVQQETTAEQERGWNDDTSMNAGSYSTEIRALEGLAVCLSRQLDDAGAEATQRKALALRCRAWEGGSGVVSTGERSRSRSVGSGSGSGCVSGLDPSKVMEAKRAALPCLRNLANFISNQGRHADAEVVLRTVLNTLEDYNEELSKGSQRRDAKDKDGVEGGKSVRDSVPACPDGEEGSDVDPAAAAAASSLDTRRLSLSTSETSSSTTTTSRGSDGADAVQPSARQPLLGMVEAKGGTATLDARRIIIARGGGSSNNAGSGGHERENGSFTPGLGQRSSSVQAAGDSAGGTVHHGGTTAQATAALAAETATTAIKAATGAAVVNSATAMGRSFPTRMASPAPPPPSPIPANRQRDADRTTVRCASSGELEEGRLSRTKSGGDSEGHRGGGVVERDLDSIEGGDNEDPQQMAAVTRHLLAVVVHAQGRVSEAELLLEDSIRALKRRNPPQALWVAQALHDLASVVRPVSPARACTLYLEALKLLEGTRGVNHFLTAPTLAKLGSLLGDSLVAKANIRPAPAAPAGPGPAGVARAEGLAEAVCAPAGCGDTSMAEAVAAAAGGEWDAKRAEEMIKRAVLIQGRNLGLRHPAVASSMTAMAELYRKQGRLAEAEPLFRRAISIWEVSPGPMDSEAVAALHGTAHCVLAGAGADWMGRFEEAFDLVDQAYRISSSHPGNDASSRLLLEALRMIRSRQRQGRGDPQPASAAIMAGVWEGRWDPSKNADGVDEGGGGSGGKPAHARNRSGSGDNPRCAVCLEEVGGGEEEEIGQKVGGLTGFGATGDWTADIGSKEAFRTETENVHARGSFAYLPCGHRFHTNCIGRWLAHSSSCPSCRSRLVDEEETTASSSPSAPSSPATDGASGPSPQAASTAAARGARDDSPAAQSEGDGGQGGGGRTATASSSNSGWGVGQGRGEDVGGWGAVSSPEERAPFC